jgi:hypothetical protein
VNEEEARLSIKNESGNTFDLVFSREADYYKLDAGYLPTGDYQYRAYINVNNREESYTSNFVVKALQLEMADLEARHDILYQLGEISGGKMYYPGQIAELEKTLADKKAKPVIFNTASFHNLINIKWIFFLILALISLEWFMRRYHGAY